MKKLNNEHYNLYNFNKYDEDVKKNKKSVKRKKEPNKKEFENEIIIGLTPKINQNQEITKKEKGPIVHKKNNKISKAKKNVQKENNEKKTVKRLSKKQKHNSKIKKRKILSEKEKEKIKKKKIRNLKISKYFILTICIIAIIIGIMTSSIFNIKQIIVKGNDKVTENEIISLSGIILNENIFKTIINKSENKILENPYIKCAEIKRKLPANIEIIVEERKTNFMLEYGSGYVYTNNQGYILEISSKKLNVPILQGAETNAENFVPGNRLCTEDLNKMDTVIKIMDVANNNDIAELITRIDIQNSENYMIQFEGEGKVAYLGDASDLSTKMLTIKAILEKETGIEGTIFVDMDLKTNNPVFRQRV